MGGVWGVRRGTSASSLEGLNLKSFKSLKWFQGYFKLIQKLPHTHKYHKKEGPEYAWNPKIIFTKWRQKVMCCFHYYLYMCVLTVWYPSPRKENIRGFHANTWHILDMSRDLASFAKSDYWHLGPKPHWVRTLPFPGPISCERKGLWLWQDSVVFTMVIPDF